MALAAARTSDSGTSGEGTANAAAGTLIIGGGVAQFGKDDTIANTFAGPIVVGTQAALAVSDNAALGTLNAGDPYGTPLPNRATPEQK